MTDTDPLPGPIPAAHALLRQWADDGECLGGQVFVWHDGRVTADFAVGHGDPDRAASVGDAGRLYCAVKPLTAVCVAGAVQDGEAGFDDPVNRFLPAFAPGGRTGITLRQLLSHTSGMSDAFLDPYEHGFDKLVSIASGWHLPDDTWFREPRYNDLLAWDVLAAVVQRIYRRDFTDVLAERVLRPAALTGLRMTGPDPTRYRRCHRATATGFGAVAEPVEEVLFATLNPASGGFGAARDLGLFYAELVRCADGTGKVLDPATMHEMARTQSRVDFGMGGEPRTYGLGFVTGVGADGIGGGWSDRSLGHAGYVGRYRVVHGFADLDHRVAAAIRLFSVGAKNNWRFHRLGAALWSDLAPAVADPGVAAAQNEERRRYRR
jgi:CubicO group peptidase (beta-lactamase class C family)